MQSLLSLGLCTFRIYCVKKHAFDFRLIRKLTEENHQESKLGMLHVIALEKESGIDLSEEERGSGVYKFPKIPETGDTSQPQLTVRQPPFLHSRWIDNFAKRNVFVGLAHSPEGKYGGSQSSRRLKWKGGWRGSGLGWENTEAVRYNRLGANVLVRRTDHWKVLRNAVTTP